MIRLYPYQNTLVSRIRESMAAGHKSIVVQSPTGSGKTVIFSYIVSEMLKRGKRALIITDRIELLNETGGTLSEFGIHAAEIVAGHRREPDTGNVFIAMSETLRRRVGKWPRFFRSFDVVIVDEIHRQGFNWTAGQFTGYVLGFTATPVRSGKMRQLGADYADLILGPQVPELIRDGFLVPDRYYGVKGVDMDGVRVSSLGDYREDDMFNRYDKREIYTGAVDNWRRICQGSMTLGFGVNIIHVARLAAEFNAAGVGARFVTSDLSPESEHFEEWRELRRLYGGERGAVLAAWRRREFPVLFNAGILTTGYNVREVETILISRSTVSLPLWLQILGRGSRTYPGKQYFNVLDFGDNSSRLGYYNQMREWSLWHKQSKGGGAPPVKECKKCKCYVFATLRECPFCGYVFPVEKTVKVAELVAVDYTAEVPQRSPYLELERRAEERGYKHGWVITQILLREGRDGLWAYAREKGYKAGWVWATEKRYSGALRGAKN